MPKSYAREFSEDVICVARNREPDVLLQDIANDFVISESCLVNWLKSADVEDGVTEWVAAHRHHRATRRLGSSHRCNT